MHRRIHRTALYALLMSLTTALALPLAQPPAFASEPARDGSAAGERDVDAAGMLADQFVMMMSHALAGEASPRPDQLRRAHLLMDHALELRADDAELWRMRAELADHMDDADAYRDAMRHYMRLRPNDDVAQLDRFLEGISAMQTLDERLERLETILQARSAQQLSGPLRSRLATHAAFAAQELGDDARLARWLREATRLDPANPEAAELTEALTQRQDAGPADRGNALVNLVRAAPADPLARLRLARWLTTHASYATADEQFAAALTLAGAPLPPDVYAYWVIALAAAGETGPARQLLDEIAPLQQDETAPTRRQPRGVPIDPEAYPSIRLSLEILRLALLDQPEGVEQSFAVIRSLLEQEGDEPPAWVDGDAAHEPETARKLMQAWIAALFNHQLDTVPDLLADAPDNDVLVRRARGWVHVHRDEPDQAREQFEPIADEDPLAAFGLARLDAAEGSDPAGTLQAIIHDDGGGIAGLLAARQLRREGHSVAPTRASRTVRTRMDQSPLSLWRPALNVSPWITMHLRVAPDRVGYLEPLHATLELRNTSRFAMPISAGRGIPERALLSPAPTLGGEPLPRPAPTIVDIRRRLTLQPGEALRVTVRLDRTSLGSMMQANPARTLSLNMLGVLGPRPTPAGGVRAEPVGAVDSVRAVTLRGTPLTEQRLEDWLTQLASDEPVQQMRALAQLLRSVDHLPEEIDTQTNRRRVAEAVNQRFAEMDTTQQAWAVRFVTDSNRSRELFRRIFEAGERSDEPLVRLAYLATHQDGRATSALNAALRDDDATIRTYAEALRDAAAAREAAQDDADDSDNAS